MNRELISKAIAMARKLQLRATELQTPPEKRQQAELDRMLQTPSDKATLVQLTDQAFRAKAAARVADQFTHILDVQGVPRFFSPLDRAMLRGFQTFGAWLPGVSVPMVKEHMRQETANVILPAERELLAEHLRLRREQGMRMNVNFLGEAILSEAEAERRLTLYLEALQEPETEVFSVKISTLYSQMSPIAREHTVAVLCDRLERLYRCAARATFLRHDGVRVPKFLYLDMEEYRDLSLTCEVFMRTLERRGLEKISAGIVLPAYVPDSHIWQQTLLEWARRRVQAGGRGDHDADRERREHGDGAARGIGEGLAAGSVRFEDRHRRELQVHVAHGIRAAESRGRASRHRLAQSLRCRLRARARDREQGDGSRAIRDARRHGESPAPRAFRGSAESPALLARVPQGALPQRHRLPHSASR